MKCTKCGTNNPASNNTCLECGSPLGIICPHCQQVVAKNAEFCLNCGEFFANVAAENERAKQQARSSRIGAFSKKEEESEWSFGKAVFETVERDGQTVSILRKLTNLKVSNVTLPSHDPQGYPIVEIAKKEGDETGGVFCDETQRIRDFDYQVCTKLTSIKIPDSVTVIGDDAFSGCIKLQEIDIPDSVTTFGRSAFFKCESLSEIYIPDSVTTMDFGCLSACDKLTYVVIPDGVSTISVHMFGTCKSLTTVVLPDSITSIENMAFSMCKNLTSIEIPNSVTKIGIGAFEWCDNLIDITIGSNVNSIGEDAFCGCQNVRRITIPASVTSIGKDAFSCCHKLYSITYLGTRSRWPSYASKGYLGLNDSTIISCSDDSAQTITTPTLSNSSSYSNYSSSSSSGGCYVATCVYGSYDCPQVWTLRRFRDDTLGATWYGRAFIRTYYAISPTLVKWFGKTTWFKRMWHGTLNKMVSNLNSKGVADTPYQDKDWR